jgi:hypothetical protein
MFCHAGGNVNCCMNPSVPVISSGTRGLRCERLERRFPAYPRPTLEFRETPNWRFTLAIEPRPVVERRVVPTHPQWLGFLPACRHDSAKIRVTGRRLPPQPTEFVLAFLTDYGFNSCSAETGSIRWREASSFYDDILTEERMRDVLTEDLWRSDRALCRQERRV